jgi:hypothetical protein
LISPRHHIMLVYPIAREILLSEIEWRVYARYCFLKFKPLILKIKTFCKFALLWVTFPVIYSQMTHFELVWINLVIISSLKCNYQFWKKKLCFQGERFVFHFTKPSSISAYYQECGRARWDGALASCMLFYLFSDHLFLQRDGCIKLLWLLFPSNHSNCLLSRNNKGHAIVM